MSKSRPDAITEALAREAIVLAQIGRVISSSLDIQEIYEQFADSVGRLLKFDRIVINYLDSESDELEIAYLSGVPVPESAAGTRVKIQGSIDEQVLQMGAGLILKQEQLSKMASRFPKLAPSLRSMTCLLAVPLVSMDAVVGVLSFASGPAHTYSQEDLTIAGHVADQIAGAVANARLHQSLVENQAANDKLAGENAAIAEIGRIVGSSLKLEEQYELFAQQVRSLLPFDRIAITILDETRENLKIAHFSGLGIPGWDPTATIQVVGSIDEYVIRTQRGTIFGPDRLQGMVEKFPALAPTIGQGIRTMLAVPLTARGDVIGVLSLDSLNADVYSELDLILAERIASQIAGAVANAELHRSVDQDRQERQALAELTRVISSSLKISEVYDQFVKAVGRLIGFHTIGITVLDLERGVLSTEYRAGEYASEWQNAVEIPLAGSIEEMALNGPTPVLFQTEDLDEVSEKLPGELPGFRDGIRTLMGIPLSTGDKTIAFLVISAKEVDAYSAHDLDLAQRIGNQIVGAIANSELHRAVNREARYREALAEIGRCEWRRDNVPPGRLKS